jgi:hypothetical protein
VILKQSKGYLDRIFKVLAMNKSVEKLVLVGNSKIQMNLSDPNSLRFIETNSTLKTLNFSNIQFSHKEMNILGESLLKNDTLTELNFSFSNFTGPFDFLKKKNLKIFDFKEIWNFYSVSFSQFLDSNSSLISLDLSPQFYDKYQNVDEIKTVIDILSDHKTLERITLNHFSDKYLNFDFSKLLKIQNLKELRLKNCLTLKSLEYILIALNTNTSLTILDISENELTLEPKWEIKITNKILKCLDLTSIDDMINISELI